MENRNFLIDKVGCSWYPIKTSFLALVIALFYHFCFNFTLFVHTGHVKFDFNAIWKTLNSQQLRILALGFVIVWGQKSHIRKNEFEKINWPTVSNRVEQCLAMTAYNFKNALSPKYMGDIYSLHISPNIRTGW